MLHGPPSLLLPRIFVGVPPCSRPVPFSFFYHKPSWTNAWSTPHKPPYLSAPSMRTVRTLFEIEVLFQYCIRSPCWERRMLKYFAISSLVIPAAYMEVWFLRQYIFGPIIYFPVPPPVFPRLPGEFNDTRRSFRSGAGWSNKGKESIQAWWSLYNIIPFRKVLDIQPNSVVIILLSSHHSIFWNKVSRAYDGIMWVSYHFPTNAQFPHIGSLIWSTKNVPFENTDFRPRNLSNGTDSYSLFGGLGVKIPLFPISMLPICAPQSSSPPFISNPSACMTVTLELSLS